MFEQETLHLDPGDVLVVFSDGITEAFNGDGEEFGDDRLVSCVQESRELAPPALLEHLFERVHRFTAGAVQSDDLTALVVRFVGA
jgi:serine phosphatase RsbU (regulator of sigma subunit)